MRLRAVMAAPNGRYTGLVDRGWRIHRYTKYDVYGDPARIVDELTRALELP